MSQPQIDELGTSRPHPNGQEISVQQKLAASTIERIIRDVELRKLALDQACKLTPSLADTSDVMKLARDMHEFLTAGATAALPS